MFIREFNDFKVAQFLPFYTPYFSRTFKHIIFHLIFCCITIRNTIVIGFPYVTNFSCIHDSFFICKTLTFKHVIAKWVKLALVSLYWMVPAFYILCLKKIRMVSINKVVMIFIWIFYLFVYFYIDSYVSYITIALIMWVDNTIVWVDKTNLNSINLKIDTGKTIHFKVDGLFLKS